jgi:hypothetical protein
VFLPSLTKKVIDMVENTRLSVASQRLQHVMDSSGGVQFGNFGIDNCDRVLSIITHGLSGPLAAVPAAISCQNPLTTSVTYVTHRADVTAPAHSLGNKMRRFNGGRVKIMNGELEADSPLISALGQNRHPDDKHCNFDPGFARPSFDEPR